MSERIHATYWLETGDDPQRAADVIAGEQSSGTFVALPNETPELKARSGARVEGLTVLETVGRPSLAGGIVSERYTRCTLELSWPIENLGASLPNLLSTIAGNLFELRQVSGLRLTGLTLPPSFASAYPGPAFGIEGTRRLSGVTRGPLIGTIIKPSVGLSPEQTAQQVRELVAGGIDFIKDDELQADGPHCPFDERVRAVMRVVNAEADRTGKKAMVAFNLTGDLDQMRRRHDLVLAEGGTCVMAVLNSIGLVGMHELRRHAQLPIHAHRAGWGYLSRCAELGWDYAPWQMIWRLAGADHLHVNGLRNKFSEPDDSVIAAARAVLAPVMPEAPMSAMPVFSSGQTGLQAADTYAAIGCADLIHTAGGGIFGHPGGVAAGVEALREAWVAAIEGVPLRQHASRHPALNAALEFWK
ncbi:ribulose-bisphosphate carboxylase large subunit family protein [Paraburkholderia sp. 22099]|uniref:Ribulose-bisphosphate carboxylase large chain n=1 Tax=Paraburkholderia terricola TaxID=169427 RepID=A0A1M6PNC6_9BURK|nr:MULTISPECIES: ribulose-bisphosphate carboxylase large subunit family protein [Paraburkholderia]ORC51349.1 ribulose 1,5-bisphosphate carboxylase [Burkholderia sp. A27]MDR6446592.1 ribulose-bisphosphate carboxylase large chain [Paraburkholderia terricola]MDR6490170.1 ribulose-bisphosphate carboxylase large chain [Paraburkholderia terricola]SDO47401.1 ribulose-bisphosphate carboxylase large chain [Paraburkholderia sediminicola]SHK09388.1 ribulose-bisphosphate carboxylase large chain [Paraburkh